MVATKVISIEERKLVTYQGNYTDYAVKSAERLKARLSAFYKQQAEIAHEEKVIEKLKFMDYAPVLFISAKTGQRTNTVFDKVKEVYETSRKRITTGILNDVVNDATGNLQPPLQGTRRLKIYYATQTGIQPPTFVFFVNDETLMSFSYERYLENFFRKTFPLEGTPIRFILRERKKED